MSGNIRARERIDAVTMRRLFNEADYHQQALSGVLVALVEANRHPSAPKANEPVCTRSQIIHYYRRDGQKVAVVHQYLRKDGTLGASGRPDPKLLWIDGTLYSLDSS